MDPSVSILRSDALLTRQSTGGKPQPNLQGGGRWFESSIAHFIKLRVLKEEYRVVSEALDTLRGLCAATRCYPLEASSVGSLVEMPKRYG